MPRQGTSSPRPGRGPPPPCPPPDTGSGSPARACAPRARYGRSPAVGPRPRSVPDIGPGRPCRAGGPTRRGSRARLQRVLHRVIFHLVLGDLFHARDGHVFAGHAMLAAEDREELLAGSRLVRRGEFLRKGLPTAAHAEAATDAKRLHGNGESRDWAKIGRA